MKEFWLAFVPLFVSVDAIGVLPLFLSLTQGLPEKRMRAIVVESVVTATVVALLFLGLGLSVLGLLGITIADLMIAGGTLLFVISMNDLLSFQKGDSRAISPEDVGVVPLGVPLIAGPAVLTTSILLLNQYGPWPTALALVSNIAIAGVVFWHSGRLFLLLGRAGTKAVSKIAGILLASIAVMMVRRGVLAVIESFFEKTPVAG